jgi:putative SOS response-associated peptidase YedK
MCGRFALFSPPARLARFFEAGLAEGLDPEGTPSYNVAPTQLVLGVGRTHDDRRELGAYRWGLVPARGGEPAATRGLINARAETIGTKPSFRDAFAQRRLIVPADGFYEWRTSAGGSKQPYYFHRRDGEPLAFAGLWERWRAPDERPPGPRGADDRSAGNEPPARNGPGTGAGAVTRTCCIITTGAGPDMDGVHDRMPVILTADTIGVWLDREADPGQLRALLHESPPGTLAHHPVDRRVGNVRFDEPALLEVRPTDPALFEGA